MTEDLIMDALNRAYDHEGKEVEYELPLPELPLPQADLPRLL